MIWKNKINSRAFKSDLPFNWMRLSVLGPILCVMAAGCTARMQDPELQNISESSVKQRPAGETSGDEGGDGTEGGIGSSNAKTVITGELLSPIDGEIMSGNQDYQILYFSQAEFFKDSGSQLSSTANKLDFKSETDIEWQSIRLYDISAIEQVSIVNWKPPEKSGAYELKFESKLGKISAPTKTVKFVVDNEPPVLNAVKCAEPCSVGPGGFVRLSLDAQEVIDVTEEQASLRDQTYISKICIKTYLPDGTDTVDAQDPCWVGLSAYGMGHERTLGDLHLFPFYLGYQGGRTEFNGSIYAWIQDAAGNISNYSALDFTGAEGAMPALSLAARPTPAPISLSTPMTLSGDDVFKDLNGFLKDGVQLGASGRVLRRATGELIVLSESKLTLFNPSTNETVLLPLPEGVKVRQIDLATDENLILFTDRGVQKIDLSARALISPLVKEDATVKDEPLYDFKTGSVANLDFYSTGTVVRSGDSVENDALVFSAGDPTLYLNEVRMGYFRNGQLKKLSFSGAFSIDRDSVLKETYAIIGPAAFYLDSAKRLRMLATLCRKNGNSCVPSGDHQGLFVGEFRENYPGSGAMEAMFTSYSILGGPGSFGQYGFPFVGADKEAHFVGYTGEQGAGGSSIVKLLGMLDRDLTKSPTPESSEIENFVSMFFTRDSKRYILGVGSEVQLVDTGVSTTLLSQAP